MTREERITVFQENKDLFSAGKFSYEGESEYYSEPFELEPEPPAPGGTRFEVIGDDCVEVAHRLVAEGYDTAILNMASRLNPGGGVASGSGAQEEQLCRRSNLLLSLFPFCRRMVDTYPELKLKSRKGQYPLHPRYGGIYSPDVLFFS